MVFLDTDPKIGLHTRNVEELEITPFEEAGVEMEEADIDDAKGG